MATPNIDIRMTPGWENLLIKETRPEWERAAKDMADHARRSAPRLTGDLANSITSEVVGSGEDIAAIAYATVDYAPFVEVGTSDTQAQPYLRPALVKVAKRRFR